MDYAWKNPHSIEKERKKQAIGLALIFIFFFKKGGMVNAASGSAKLSARPIIKNFNLKTFVGVGLPL
jgi:hypothetical protein